MAGAVLLLIVGGCQPDRPAVELDGDGQNDTMASSVARSDDQSTSQPAPRANSDADRADADGASGSGDAVGSSRSATSTTAPVTAGEIASADLVSARAAAMRRPDPRDLLGEPEPPSRPRLAIRADGQLSLSFDDLEFPIKQDQDFQREMLTDTIEGYDGQVVTIRGFILPASVFEQRGIEKFVLVRDNQQCCFGPGAYVYHNIQVEMEPGRTAEFSIRPVTVEGTFRIKPWHGPDGKCYSVYHLSATSVK